MPVIVIGFDEGKNKVPVSPKDETDASLENKVDKVEGKGLSANDYTNEEKAEVAKVANKQDQHSKATATLLAANWVAKTQRISVEGVTANNTVIVSANYTSIDEYSASGVVCMGQYAGELAFSCKYTPANDLDINIVILGV